MTRIALVVLEAIVALNAFAGGYYGMSGAPSVPPEWLDGTPFEDYVVPGLILFVAVGGSMSAAALAGAFAGRRRASLAGLSAAVVLLGWIVVQVAMIGYVSFLQPLFFAIGVAIFVVAWRLYREAAGQSAAATAGRSM